MTELQVCMEFMWSNCPPSQFTGIHPVLNSHCGLFPLAQPPLNPTIHCLVQNHTMCFLFDFGIWANEAANPSYETSTQILIHKRKAQSCEHAITKFVTPSVNTQWSSIQLLWTHAPPKPTLLFIYIEMLLCSMKLQYCS